MAGIDKIADATVCTLGPGGRWVLIADSVVVDYGVAALPVRVTRDGYLVTKSFDVTDPYERAGVMLVKEAAQKTVTEAGDATTTTCLLMREISKIGIAMVEAGKNPVEIKRSLDAAVKYFVEELKKMATPVRGDIERVRQIATVSGNNDPEIGNLIAEAIEKIGDEGVINLHPSDTMTTELKITDGYSFDRGWISPLFATNREKQVCEFENPYILLYEKRINNHKQIENALTLANSNNRSILIICEDSDDEGLAFLIRNTIEKRIRCCVVKAPGFGESRREEMEDIATLTGGQYIVDTKGRGIKEVGLDSFGNAKKVVVTKDQTVIIGGDATVRELDALKNELRMNLAQAKTEGEKAPIEKRLAKLNGSVAVIHVGATTETERDEKLDRFDDAVRATKAAIAEGYVPGSGLSFLRINYPDGNDIGISILREIATKPLRQIAENAGANADQVLDAVLKSNGSVGYNAKTDTIEDLEKSGIIDPVKVIRCALQNAASSAGVILTTEVLISSQL